MKRKYLLISLLFLLLLPQCGGNSDQGNPNNDFEFNLPDLQGKTHRLEDYQGQILVLNFWATWCPPCLQEVPKLNELYEGYKDRGVQVVGIALDKDSLELVAPYVKEYRIEYPILVGNQQVLGGLKNFKGVPTTLLFDREGKIRKRFDGSFEVEQLEEGLQLLLED